MFVLVVLVALVCASESNKAGAPNFIPPTFRPLNMEPDFTFLHESPHFKMFMDGKAILITPNDRQEFESTWTSMTSHVKDVGTAELLRCPDYAFCPHQSDSYMLFFPQFEALLSSPPPPRSAPTSWSDQLSAWGPTFVFLVGLLLPSILSGLLAFAKKFPLFKKFLSCIEIKSVDWGVHLQFPLCFCTCLLIGMFIQITLGDHWRWNPEEIQNLASVSLFASVCPGYSVLLVVSFLGGYFFLFYQLCRNPPSSELENARVLMYCISLCLLACFPTAYKVDQWASIIHKVSAGFLLLSGLNASCQHIWVDRGCQLFLIVGYFVFAGDMIIVPSNPGSKEVLLTVGLEVLLICVSTCRVNSHFFVHLYNNRKMSWFASYGCFACILVVYLVIMAYKIVYFDFETLIQLKRLLKGVQWTQPVKPIW